MAHDSTTGVKFSVAAASAGTVSDRAAVKHDCADERLLHSVAAR